MLLKDKQHNCIGTQHCTSNPQTMLKAITPKRQQRGAQAAATTTKKEKINRKNTQYKIEAR